MEESYVTLTDHAWAFTKKAKQHILSNCTYVYTCMRADMYNVRERCDNRWLFTGPGVNEICAAPHLALRSAARRRRWRWWYE